MSLSSHQKEFAAAVGELLVWIFETGDFEVTFGDAYRDPRAFGSIGEKKLYSHKNSNHKNRLAIDLNLFNVEGEYLVRTEDYKPIANYWLSLHPSARWGGDFADGNHFSFEYRGMR